MTEEIDKLISKGAESEVTLERGQFVSRIFTIPKKHKRSVVRERAQSLHQFRFGVDGRRFCSENVCPTSNGYTPPVKDGQQNSIFFT